MSKVFISYRREDAAGYAQAIYGQLERHLRRDQIFMDVDTIPPGVDFVTHIEQAVSECDVLIAMIGKRWSGERENGPPRIHDPQDFVHLEIAAALSRNIRVIPILVDGASMPNKDQLPRTLQPLVRRNALEVSNTRFRFDLDRVSQAVRKALVPQMRYGDLSSLVAIAVSIVQVLVALGFLAIGLLLLVSMPEGALEWDRVFIGLSSVLGALGLMLPWLPGVWPLLAPLSAIGLVVLMIGLAFTRSTSAMESLELLVVALLTAFVAYARWKLVPHSRSSQVSVPQHRQKRT